MNFKILQLRKYIQNSYLFTSARLADHYKENFSTYTSKLVNRLFPNLNSNDKEAISTVTIEIAIEDSCPNGENETFSANNFKVKIISKIKFNSSVIKKVKETTEDMLEEDLPCWKKGNRIRFIKKK